MYPPQNDPTRRLDPRDAYDHRGGAPHGSDPYVSAGYVEPAREPRRRSGLDLGTLAGSVLATGLVAAISGALVAWIIAAVFDRFGHVWANGGNTPLMYAIYGAVAALSAGLIWYLLVVGTADPSGFFSWIVGLLILAAVVLPLLITTPFLDGLAAAIVHLGIGLPILTLTGSFTRTSHR